MQKTVAFWDVCQKCRLKVRCCGDLRGKSFHRCGPTTSNDRLPNVVLQHDTVQRQNRDDRSVCRPDALLVKCVACMRLQSSLFSGDWRSEPTLVSSLRQTTPNNLPHKGFDAVLTAGDWPRSYHLLWLPWTLATQERLLVWLQSQSFMDQRWCRQSNTSLQGHRRPGI